MILEGIAAAVGIGALIYNAYQQGKQLEYQKELNRKLMKREDTAVQRRRLDLIRAGFSPVLAAGDPAQSHPLEAGKAPGIDNPMLLMDLLRGSADITRTQQDIEFSKKQMKVADTVETLNQANASKAYADADAQRWNTLIAKKFGMPTGQTGLAGEIRGMTGVMGRIKENYSNFKNDQYQKTHEALKQKAQQQNKGR